MEIDNFLPGSAALIDMIDKPLQVTLRDGHIYYGTLISYDQFANLVLDCFEMEATNCIVIVRGENVVMVGEIEDLTRIQVKKRESGRVKNLQGLQALGFCVETVAGDDY